MGLPPLKLHDIRWVPVRKSKWGCMHTHNIVILHFWMFHQTTSMYVCILYQLLLSINQVAIKWLGCRFQVRFKTSKIDRYVCLCVCVHAIWSLLFWWMDRWVSMTYTHLDGKLTSGHKNKDTGLFAQCLGCAICLFITQVLHQRSHIS
jgi:hypothetical protein